MRTAIEPSTVQLSPTEGAQRIFQKAVIHKRFGVEVGTLFQSGDLQFGALHYAFGSKVRRKCIAHQVIERSRNFLIHLTMTHNHFDATVAISADEKQGLRHRSDPALN